MKRALVVVPLIALLLGLLVFFGRHWVAELRPGAKRTGPAAPADPSQSSSPAAPGAPSAEPGPAIANTAQIQFTVTCRGLPVPNARIIVQKQGTDYFMKFNADAKGSLLLRGLPAQDYGILVESPDHLPFSTEAHPAVGQTTQIPVELKQGGKVYGTVTDKAGHPISKCRVLVLGERQTPSEGGFLETDEQGKYVVRGLPPGNFGLRFRHKQFKPLDRQNLFFRSHTDEYQVDVTLEVGARVAGRVLDPEGRPVEGAMVQAGNKGSAQLDKTDKEGKFSLGGLNDAPVGLTIAKDGYAKVVLRNQPINGPEMEIRLVKGGTVAGRVVLDEAPRQVQVTLSTYDQETRQVVMADSKFFPDPPNGEFAVPDVAPGTYWVDVAIEGYEAIERPQVIVASGQSVQGIVVTFRKKT